MNALHRSLILSMARAAIVASLAVPLTPAVAAEQSYGFDGAHTSVVFRVKHLGLSGVFGRFDSVNGSINVDPANLAGASVSATMEASSVNTNNEKRDKHLRSPDFFNAGEFPTLEFKSTNLDLKDGKTGTLTGDLTLLGVTKPVSLAVTVNHNGPHPSPQAGGAAAVGISANGTITRSEFGMTGFLPGLGDDVEFWIEVEAIAK